jgi:esterase FrsA
VFTFDVRASDLFAERSRQFVGWGIPRDTVRRMRARIHDVWSDARGGWCTEWCEEARAFEGRRDAMRAALCYGAARFPFACTESRRAAQREQLRAFLDAAPRFPCRFDRIELEVEHRGETTPVPVHVYEPRAAAAPAVVLLCGGLDTYKMELHRLALSLVHLGGLAVVSMDMPGTGESRVALTPDADGIFRGVIARAARGRRVGLWGISFGGYWAARLALQEDVSCAVDHGGLVGSVTNGPSLLSLPNGMTGTLGNALGLDAIPPEAALQEMVRSFSLERRGLLREATVPVPLLVLNGSDDQYIPRRDATIFAGKRNATVLLVPKATHCAAEALPRIVPTVIEWLVRQLRGRALRTVVLRAVAGVVAPHYEVVGT